eukprot:CAMPEP_0185007056 /NCGR_PEP_ID=MMETSP1098-20130426/86140_1 /TAXON_ID=89044 /ORGANISM="Spumella elongata, Strain CCAP 955/1" /LENGTH=500 /DNA_ID=CAMNT_0027535325 /DNA_START=91 /DNA_END=1593 /DNA_ORIENTATION=+
MPSIALFIKQLLSEDKYSSGFSDRINDRIKELNAAQLQGIYNHLQATAKNSKSAIWLSANKELMSKIEGVLKEQVAEAQKVDKILEESRLKAVQRKRKVKEAKIEQKRVMAMIAENARKTAEAAVREEEVKRQADEKVEITTKVFKGEERRDMWWKRTAAFFVIGVVVVCVVVTDLIILIAALVVVTLITLLLAYRAHQFTVVLPAPVDEEEIEMEIERRSDVLKKKAVSNLREKERKFEEQQRRDEEERKQRKAQKKAQLRFEAQLMAQHRQQQLANAQEVLARRTATASSAGGTAASGRATAGSAYSGFLTANTSAVDFQQVPLASIQDLEGDMNAEEQRNLRMRLVDVDDEDRQYGDIVLDEIPSDHSTDHVDTSEDDLDYMEGQPIALSDEESIEQHDAPEYIDSGDEAAVVTRHSPRSNVSPRGGSARQPAASNKYQVSDAIVPDNNDSKSDRGARSGRFSPRGVSLKEEIVQETVAEPKEIEMTMHDLETGNFT